MEYSVIGKAYVIPRKGMIKSIERNRYYANQ